MFTILFLVYFHSRLIVSFSLFLLFYFRSLLSLYDWQACLFGFKVVSLTKIFFYLTILFRKKNMYLIFIQFSHRFFLATVQIILRRSASPDFCCFVISKCLTQFSLQRTKVQNFRENHRFICSWWPTRKILFFHFVSYSTFAQNVGYLNVPRCCLLYLFSQRTKRNCV